MLDAIGRARRPALVMLAGAGLGAADALGEAGWVCTGTQPFMARTAGPAVEDPAARPLRAEELAEARVLAGSAFGVPEEVSAIVYSERGAGPTGHPGVGAVRGRDPAVLLARGVGGRPVQRGLGPGHRP